MQHTVAGIAIKHAGGHIGNGIQQAEGWPQRRTDKAAAGVTGLRTGAEQRPKPNIPPDAFSAMLLYSISGPRIPERSIPSSASFCGDQSTSLPFAACFKRT
jgi:hypothetical protein